MSALRRDVFGTGEIAHVSLKGQHAAARFVEGTQLRVARPVADMILMPARGRLDRQVLFGHPVCQLDPQSRVSRDETTGYVGHVAPGDLRDWVAPTHRVGVRTTLMFTQPDIKSPAPLPLSMGSLVHVVGHQGRFGETDDGQFVLMSHLLGVADHQPDLAATAEALLGAPYLWGGNSAFGIDCSGLVQMACQMAGLPCPGDSDQQCETLGDALSDHGTIRRNDVLFWPGHVALAYDAETLIHANAHHMAVAFEPLADAMARIEDQGDGPLLAVRRLPV
jgi:cell wall-associated NlpC family hydrolase